MNIDFESRIEDRLADMQLTLDRILAIIDKPKAVRKPKTHFISPHFDAWWMYYPKKVGKKACVAIWNNKGLDRIALDLNYDTANRVANDQQWIDGYAPNPQTYLNGERWNDDIIPIKQAQIKIPRGDAEAIVFGIERGIEAKIGESMYDFRNRLEQAL
jgi:hypothetical protein